MTIRYLIHRYLLRNYYVLYILICSLIFLLISLVINRIYEMNVKVNGDRDFSLLEVVTSCNAIGWLQSIGIFD